MIAKITALGLTGFFCVFSIWFGITHIKNTGYTDNKTYVARHMTSSIETVEYQFLENNTCIITVYKFPFSRKKFEYSHCQIPPSFHWSDLVKEMEINRKLLLTKKI